MKLLAAFLGFAVPAGDICPPTVDKRATSPTVTIAYPAAAILDRVWEPGIETFQRGNPGKTNYAAWKARLPVDYGPARFKLISGGDTTMISSIS
jgi:hypothetical protein